MENKNTPSAFELAETWLNSPVGRIPLLPEEMERLRVRVKTDEITRTAWADTCAVVDEFLGEKPGPLIPTPLAEYYSNPEATRNNNRAARFWSGWTACAWKAAVVNDQPALDRATTCLNLIVNTHKEKNGIQLIAPPDASPKRAYYLTTRSFYPEEIILRVELMRTAGFHNADILADLIERLIFLADLGVAAAEQLIQENAPYWNGDNCVGAGLLSIAAMLPDHPNAAQWETFGWKNMTGYFGNKSVLPDGTFHEAFPWAEGYGLEFLYPVLAILRSKQDIDLPNLQLSPTRTLHDAIQWQLNVASPLGEIPTLNDTSGYDICMGGYANLAVLGQWANLPEVWKAFRVTDFRLPLYLHAHRPDNPPEPEPESLLLPDIGWSFLRSGQGLNAFHSMFDHGIHPSGHCMPQNLTFDMVCHGHHWIVNSGCAPHYCTYDEQNTWHRTTKAANCIRIDNQDIPPNIDSELLEWTNHNGTVTVRGRHQGYPAVVHERTLIHQEHGPLLVLDHLTPTDGKSHTAQAFWHINGQIEKKETGRWIFTAGNNRSLYLLCPELSSATPVTEGLCGGLGRRNLNAGKLPSIDPVSPGDPGWLLVPYLSLDMEIPASGKTLITAFVPQIDTSESSWTLNIKSGNVHIFRNGEMLLSTPLE